jgi:hypothetical protein
MIGRCGRSSWSLPKAMFEPQNETEPTIAENSDGTTTASAPSEKPPPG